MLTPLLLRPVFLVSLAGDLEDLVGGFERQEAGDGRGRAARCVELAFHVIELPGPERDMGVDDDPGQQFGLLQGAAEDGGAIGLQDLGWIASCGENYGGRVAGGISGTTVGPPPRQRSRYRAQADSTKWPDLRDIASST